MAIQLPPFGSNLPCTAYRSILLLKPSYNFYKKRQALNSRHPSKGLSLIFRKFHVIWGGQFGFS
jgi:hypothetical protein